MRTGPHSRALNFGGLGRNRTGIQGFAVLCITTLPPGQSLLMCNYTKQKKIVIQLKNCNIYDIILEIVRECT